MWGAVYPGSPQKNPPTSERRAARSPDDGEAHTEDRLLSEGRWEDLIEHYLARADAVDLATRAKLFQRIATIFHDQLDDVDQAFDALLEAFSLNPSDEEISEPLVRLARKLLRWPELVEETKKKIAAEGDAARRLSFSVHLTTWYREELGAHHLADPYLAKIREIDPTHPAVHRRLASMYRQQGDWEGQRDELERALLRAETPAARRDVEFALGYLFERMQRLDQAQERYRKALVADPSSIAALQGLERIYETQEKYGDLLDVLERQVEEAADVEERISALLRLAALQEERFVKPQIAARKLELVLALDPTRADARDGIERCYRALRAWDDLVRALERRASVTESAETRSRIFLQVAEIEESSSQNLDAAIAALLQASQADENNKRALYDLARLSEKKGDFPAAAAFRAQLAERTKDPVKRAQIHAAIGDMLATSDRDPTAARLHFERAVALDPTLVSAWHAIQRHAERSGDDARAADCLQMRASYTDSPRLKAVLYVELARLAADALGDVRQAYQAYEKAISADPTNEVAAAALLDVYVRAERWREAAGSCEIVIHAATRDGDTLRACELLELAGRIALAENDPARALQAAVAAFDLAPTSTPVRESLVEAAHRLREEPKALGRAMRALESLFQDFAGLGAPGLVRLGEIALVDAHDTKAIEILRAALLLDAYHPGAHAGLAEAFLARGAFELAAKHKENEALGSPDVGQQFELLLQAGEIWAQQAHDLEEAARVYEEAVAIFPTDRRALHTLLALYERTEEWANVARILRLIADLESEPQRRAKALYAMAQVLRDKVRDLPSAASIFEEVLALDASRLDAFERVVRIHTERKDWPALEASYRAMLKRLQTSDDVGLKHAVCHQLGLLYRDRLADAERALAAFRAAATFKPERDQERQIVSELLVLTGDVAAAVDLTRASIERDPHATQPYSELYGLFLRQHAFDRAWCVVDVLAHLEAKLDDEQSQFYSGHPATKLEHLPGTLSPGAWDTHILHPHLDPLLTAIFRTVMPVVLRAKLAAVSPRAHQRWLGVKVQDAPSDRAYAILRAFLDGAEVLGVSAPELHARGGVHAPLNVPVAAALSRTPSLFVSFDLVTGLTSHELSFLVGKHIAELQPELLARAFFPTVGELKGLLHMAVRVVSDGLPGARRAEAANDGRLDAAVLEAIKPQEMEALRTAVNDAQTRGAKLDVKRWSQLADLSSARAGLLLAGTVHAAHRANVQGERGPGDLTPREWMSELMKFVVSDAYADLRSAIGTGLNRPV